VNVVVDPYRVFDLVDIRGFNAVKSRALQRGQMSKMRSIMSIHPQRIILGNSRAQVGLDPESAQWPDTRKTYNAALPGTGLETTLLFLRAAVAGGQLREAVIGLEFLDFLVDDRGEPEPSSGTLLEDQAKVDREISKIDLKSLLSITLSLDALLDSMYTLLAQHVAGSPDLTKSGFTPMRDYAAMAKRDGYASFFRQRDMENSAAYLRKPKALFYQKSRSSPGWRQLQDIRGICKQLARGCTFIVYPYHGHVLELFALTGLWPSFEEWKRQLVRSLAAPAPGQDDKGKLVLWDFSGYHRFACERVPAKDDRSTAMQWYWEAGHFKRELGDQIIARVGGGGDPEFGIRLDQSTVEAALGAIRRDAGRYRSDHRAEVSELAQMLSKHR
jgi:hypothetical protein